MGSKGRGEPPGAGGSGGGWVMRWLLASPARGEAVAAGVGPGGQPILATASEDATGRLWGPLPATRARRPTRGGTRWAGAVALSAARGDGEAGGGGPLLAFAAGDFTVRV